MYLKVHSSPLGEVVALCDAELLGLVISEGETRLDLRSHASFYKGKRVTPREAKQALMGARNANIVGRKSLAAAQKAGIDCARALTISGVPHLQIYGIS